MIPINENFSLNSGELPIYFSLFADGAFAVVPPACLAVVVQLVCAILFCFFLFIFYYFLNLIFMSKQSVPLVRSSSSLFAIAPEYETHPIVRTELLVFEKLDDGSSVKRTVCVEDEVKKTIPLDFEEVKLQNLVDKGVDTHSLDILDTNKLGVDEGVSQLAEHLINNSDKYVNPSINS